MDFTKYAQGTAALAHSPRTSKNYDHIMDPYIRRYHITKIGLSSLTYGLLAHLLKTMAENM